MRISKSKLAPAVSSAENCFPCFPFHLYYLRYYLRTPQHESHWGTMGTEYRRMMAYKVNYKIRNR